MSTPGNGILSRYDAVAPRIVDSVRPRLTLGLDLEVPDVPAAAGVAIVVTRTILRAQDISVAKGVSRAAEVSSAEIGLIPDH